FHIQDCSPEGARQNNWLAKVLIYYPGYRFLSWQFIMFDKKMKVKISQIADLIQAEITGNPDEVITHPDKIESAKEGSITFFPIRDTKNIYIRARLQRL